MANLDPLEFLFWDRREFRDCDVAEAFLYYWLLHTLACLVARQWRFTVYLSQVISACLSSCKAACKDISRVDVKRTARGALACMNHTEIMPVAFNLLHDLIATLLNLRDAERSRLPYLRYAPPLLLRALRRARTVSRRTAKRGRKCFSGALFFFFLSKHLFFEASHAFLLSSLFLLHYFYSLHCGLLFNVGLRDFEPFVCEDAHHVVAPLFAFV